MCVFSTGSLLEEAHDVACNAAKVALAVGGDNAEQALAGLLGKIGLLEDTLGGIYVWEVESGSRMA